jgi:hypothetical protein
MEVWMHSYMRDMALVSLMMATRGSASFLAKRPSSGRSTANYFGG